VGGDDVAARAGRALRRRLQPGGEVIEVFTTRSDAETLVATWDADEPNEAGAVDVVELVIDCSLN